jgi:DNA-binding PadR family transcriptional regulator
MSLPHVLLGLLTRGPASGWDLKARLARDPSIGWDAELPQIYPALRRLLRGGFVALKRRRSTRGPARREYRLTPAGKHELFEWLAEPPAIPRVRDAELTRLALLERQPPEKRLERLRGYRALLAEALRRAAPGSTAARRRRRALLETELAWADAEVALLSAREAQREERSSARRNPLLGPAPNPA